LESVSPRFGSVEGGTQVTFSGKGFVADKTKISVIIDGVNCPVDSSTTT
jgi:hypothetical protein